MCLIAFTLFLQLLLVRNNAEGVLPFARLLILEFHQVTSDTEPDADRGVPPTASPDAAISPSSLPSGSADPSGRGAPLVVVYCSPQTVTPDPRNARTHSRQQIQQIETSIQALRVGAR